MFSQAWLKEQVVPDFGALLRNFRQCSRDPLNGKILSQQQLGELLRDEMGIRFSGAAISDWERGKSKVHADDRDIRNPFGAYFTGRLDDMAVPPVPGHG